MREFSWVSGPPEPSREDREAYEEAYDKLVDRITEIRSEYQDEKDKLEEKLRVTGASEERITEEIDLLWSEVYEHQVRKIEKALDEL